MRYWLGRSTFEMISSRYLLRKKDAAASCVGARCCGLSYDRQGCRSEWRSKGRRHRRRVALRTRSRCRSPRSRRRQSRARRTDGPGATAGGVSLRCRHEGWSRRRVAPGVGRSMPKGPYGQDHPVGRQSAQGACDRAHGTRADPRSEQDVVLEDEDDALPLGQRMGCHGAMRLPGLGVRVFSPGKAAARIVRTGMKERFGRPGRRRGVGGSHQRGASGGRAPLAQRRLKQSHWPGRSAIHCSNSAFRRRVNSRAASGCGRCSRPAGLRGS
jgi:hypothetical protein